MGEQGIISAIRQFFILMCKKQVYSALQRNHVYLQSSENAAVRSINTLYIRITTDLKI